MKVEKEIKLRVEKEDVDRILNDPKFKKEKSVFQRTTRRDKDDLSFEKEGIFIRTRQEGEICTITLKKKAKSNKDVFEREEYETTVGDEKTMNDILNELKLTKAWIMEKYRIQGTYENTVVTIDELPFGLYIEIEGEEDDIFDVCGDLGLDEEKKIVVTYWDIWEEYKRKNKLNLGEDIIFKNEKRILADC